MNDEKRFPGGYSILLAEDDKMNQVVVAGLIKSLNLGRVEIVENGRQAVEKFRSHGFDLILMDGEMPEMSGIEAALEIRSMEKERDLLPTPIIALSAHTAQEEKDLFLKSGMDAFLAKPLDPVQLKQAIQQVVPKSASQGKSDAGAGENEAAAPNIKSPIDIKELERIMTGKMNLLDKCLQTFESTFPDQMAKITTSIEKNDPDGLKKNAHRLKGMLKYLAAHNAVTFAEKLESMGVSGNTTHADITARALNDECLNIVDSIKQILEKGFA